MRIAVLVLALVVTALVAEAQGQPGTSTGSISVPPGSLSLFPPLAGTVYTRWGKYRCPSGIGTQLVYSGRAGGSPYGTQGGASNYLCMPHNPQYSLFTPGEQSWATVVGTELESRDGPLRRLHNQNVPCAVCYVPRRHTNLMIPARLTCPRGWTREYFGYLMTAVSKPGYVDKRTSFECIDARPDVVPGEAAEAPPNGAAVFYHTEAKCTGLLCPPYDPQKELTCVVCSK